MFSLYRVGLPFNSVSRGSLQPETAVTLLGEVNKHMTIADRLEVIKNEIAGSDLQNADLIVSELDEVIDELGSIFMKEEKLKKILLTLAECIDAVENRQFSPETTKHPKFRTRRTLIEELINSV